MHFFFLQKSVILSKIGKICDFSQLTVETNFPLHDLPPPFIITRFAENWQNSRLIVKIWTFFQAPFLNLWFSFRNYAIILLKKLAKLTSNYQNINLFYVWYFLNARFCFHIYAIISQKIATNYQNLNLSHGWYFF